MPAAALPLAAEPSMLSGLGVTALLIALPVLVVAGTAFIKISIVLGLLRSAVGAQDVPPTIVITALAAVLTLFVMAPVGESVYDAVTRMPAPTSDDSDRFGLAEARTLYDAATPPLLSFLKANTADSERAFYADLAGDPTETGGFRILLPAFATQQVVEAFWMGVLIFLPFLVVDLIVSTTLVALGFSTLSPATVSLPLKLLLLVAVDGWHVILSGMLLQYGT